MGGNLLFPPKHETEGEARQAILMVIRRDPATFGYIQSRWKLSLIAEVCDWLNLSNESSLWRLLQRLGIHYKRGREYIHSPDRHYLDKLSLIELARLRAYYAPDRYVFLYLDELSYYRQPTVARAYAAKGPHQALARRSHTSNTRGRAIAVLNALTGQVNYLQRSRISRLAINNFWVDVRAAYPQAELIYVVVDNWPVHFHVDSIARLEKQDFPWPPYVPPHWPKEPAAKAVQDNLPIRLLCLPTYASWLNPIEKLWRWLKQEVLHMHPYSDDWPAIKQHVASFLDRFSSGSDELLHYVGLLPN